MLPLKNYQDRALYWLGKYFDDCRALSDPNTAFYKVTSEQREGSGAVYKEVAALPRIPYVCLRIPTGGGKTLVGCHAIAHTNHRWLQRDNSLALWLVPSEAIREQTLNAMRNREHPYRQALEETLGRVEIMDIDEALHVQRPVLDSSTVIVVATMQAFRRERVEDLVVYRSNGALMSHFQDVPEDLLKAAERGADGVIPYSLCNVFRIRRPVVIVDEAHNARTGLSFDTLARLGPSCILELTATPTMEDRGAENPRSNVLYSVSAYELKAEKMIKLPIKLKTHAAWKELFRDARALLNGLQKAADREKTATGEYIRPIMLVQAQPKNEHRETLTVEVVRKALIEEFGIPEEQIARATAEHKDLDGINLLSPECPIRFVITIQALKEGWDCPFAYVLFSVAELRAERAVEQILGRVLRLPKATKKENDELNYAYAFTTSRDFEEAAEALRDGLVQNGYEKQDTAALVAPLQADLSGFHLEGAPPISIMERVAASPRKEIPKELAGKVVVDENTNQIILMAPLTSQEGERLKACFSKDDVPAVVAAVERVRQRDIANKSPAERKEAFSVPVLAYRQKDMLEAFSEDHITEPGWTLKDADARLGEADFAVMGPDSKTGEVDVTEQGRVEARLLPDLGRQLTLLSVEAAWPEVKLVRWLDAGFPHPDLGPDETGPFLTRVLMGLLRERKLSLEVLTAHRYALLRAVEKRVGTLRLAAQKETFQGFLSPELAKNFAVSEKCRFTFPPDAYPCAQKYQGQPFKKHYHAIVGEMNGEEIKCARFLDDRPEVKWWIRNLGGPGHQDTSFWLQTSKDRFYPDFVALLDDGRCLAVEYKNALDYTNEDSQEKRIIGELWQERSAGRCLFVMTKGPDFDAILKKIRR